MASDIVDIGLMVDSSSVKKGRGELNKLGQQSGKTKKATDGLTTSFGVMKAALVALAAAYPVNKLIQTTREFDKLNAGLKTAAGSAEGASRAFQAIQDFASSTPYDLQQVTDSFTKLVNYGLTPSERALTSYGNTASSLGKDLNQMIEAVADAATGEFERLKEFGIKASKDGDRVKFMFRGVATEVGNSAEEIENYLIALGENNFATAMSDRMSTLDGALSNLGDEWDKLFLAISQQGIGSVIEGSVRMAIDALSSLGNALSSGQIGAYLDAIKIKFRGFAEDASMSITFLREMFSAEMDGIGVNGSATVDFLIDAFKNIPENVRALVQIAVIEFVSMFRTIGIYAEGFVDKIKAIFSSRTFAEVDKNTADRLKMVSDLRLQSISDIITERNVAVKAADDQIDAADKLREKFEEAKAARDQAGGDRLEEFKIAGDGGEEKARQKQWERDVAWFDAEIALDEERATRKIEIEKRIADEMIAQRDRGQRAFEQYLSAAATGNKTFFKIQKLYRLSKLAMEAPAAVADAYAWGTSWGGPPAGAAMAGLAGAAMATYAAQVAGASYGGTSSGGTSSGATVGASALPAANDRPQQQEQQQQAGPTFIFNNNGTQIGADDIDQWFADSIKRASDYDMFTVEVAGQRGRVI